MNYENLTNDIVKNHSLNFIGGLVLSNHEIDILRKYNIDYETCKDMKELIFILNEYLYDQNQTDLEEIAMTISERDYYQNTNK